MSKPNENEELKMSDFQQKYKTLLADEKNRPIFQKLQSAGYCTEMPIPRDLFSEMTQNTTNQEMFQTLFEDIGCVRDKEGNMSFPTGNNKKKIIIIVIIITICSIFEQCPGVANNTKRH